MLYYMLGSTLFNNRTQIFAQFLLFLVMVFHFSQYWSFNFPFFACLNLFQSPGIATHDYSVPLSYYHGNNEDSIYELTVFR